MTQGTSKLHTINHFSHVHPLTEVNSVGPYTCDGCKLYGEGKTYRCNDCDYDLHEYCAICPTKLGNTWHAPNHELTLFSGPTHTTERSCYVCRTYIQGMFYICNHCSFETHPLCTHVQVHLPYPDASTAKQRGLHAGQPWPQYYGQGNPYGYTQHVGLYPPYSHQYPYQYSYSYMNPGSPSADPNPSTSRAMKGGLVLGAVKAVVAVTVTVAAAVAENMMI